PKEGLNVCKAGEYATRLVVRADEGAKGGAKGGIVIPNSVTDIAISADRAWIGMSRNDGTIARWKTEGLRGPGKHLAADDGRLEKRVGVLNFGASKTEPRPLLLVTGGDDEVVRVWWLDHFLWEKNQQMRTAAYRASKRLHADDSRLFDWQEDSWPRGGEEFDRL